MLLLEDVASDELLPDMLKTICGGLPTPKKKKQQRNKRKDRFNGY